MKTTTQPSMTPTEREIERFTLDSSDVRWVTMTADPEGPYVLFTEHAAALAARERETRAETWRKAIEVAVKEHFRAAERPLAIHAAVGVVVTALEAARNEGNSK